MNEDKEHKDSRKDEESARRSPPEREQKPVLPTGSSSARAAASKPASEAPAGREERRPDAPPPSGNRPADARRTPRTPRRFPGVRLGKRGSDRLRGTARGSSGPYLPRRPNPSDRPRDRRAAPDKDRRPEWGRFSKALALWALFFVLVIMVVRHFQSGGAVVEIDYTDFAERVGKGDVAKAVIVDSELRGELRPGAEAVDSKGSRSFLVRLGSVQIDSEMLQEWQRQGIKFRFEDKKFNWATVLMSILPWLLFLGIWLFFIRQMQGGPKGVFSFGKSKAKLLTEDRPKVSFKDVAGAEEAKQELQEIIEFLRDPGKFQQLGGKIPKGALLIGPPGTGKTYMAKAVAGEAGVPFFSMSGSDFVEMFVGVGASRVRDLFEQGKSNAPCIIFIDEIDAVGRHRGAGIGGGHDEREQTLNQLLVEMDGFESNEGVILLAATNRPDVLDPALLRPGRFDRQIVVDRPDVKGREGILRVHTTSRKVPLAQDVDLAVLARGTPGLSGADLANLVNEAALLGSRKNRKRVVMADFEEAKDKVMMGAERKSMVISDEEKKLLAYHEAGHGLVAKLIPGSDPVHKMTIIPRGRALGLTHYLPMDEKHTYSKSFCVAKLSHALGGRSAEKLVFGEVTTGSGNDYEQATELARHMVCEWGMSDKLGPVTYGKKNEEIFLGREISQHRDYSERTAVAIDAEIHNLLASAEQKADNLLSQHKSDLDALASALLEREVLDGHQIDRILAGQRLDRPKAARRPHRRPPRARPAQGVAESGPPPPQATPE